MFFLFQFFIFIFFSLYIILVFCFYFLFSSRVLTRALVYLNFIRVMRRFCFLRRVFKYFFDFRFNTCN